MNEAIHRRIQGFIPPEEQYRQALQKRNYTFFRDEVEGYLMSIWFEDLNGVLHFIEGAKAYPLILTAFFYKKRKVFEWVLDNNGGDLSFVSSLSYGYYDKLLKFVTGTKYYFPIFKKILEIALADYWYAFSLNIPKEFLVKGGISQFFDHFDDVEKKFFLDVLKQKKKIRMSGDSLEEQLILYYEKCRRDSIESDDEDAFKIRSRLVKETHNSSMNYEEVIEYLNEKFAEKSELVRNLWVFACTPLGKITNSNGRKLMEAVSFGYDGFVTPTFALKSPFDDLIKLQSQILGFLDEPVERILRVKSFLESWIELYIEKVRQEIESEYEIVLQRTREFLLIPPTQANDGEAESSDEELEDDNEFFARIPTLPHPPLSFEVTLIPGSYTMDDLCSFEFIGSVALIATQANQRYVMEVDKLFKSMFVLGYRLMKYELTGVLDPEGTVYDYDTTPPLISKEREELVLCFDVRVNRDKHPNEFKFNTISRYLHLEVMEHCEEQHISWYWKKLSLPRPQIPFPWEALDIFYETEIVYPAFPADQFGSKFRYPIEFYQALKDQGWLFPVDRYISIIYGPFRLTFSTTDRILNRIFAEIPVDFLTFPEWEQLLRHRDYSKTNFLMNCDFGFDKEKYNLVDRLNIRFNGYGSSEDKEVSYREMFILYNLWQFYKNNPESDMAKNYFERVLGSGIYLRMFKKEDIINHQRIAFENEVD